MSADLLFFNSLEVGDGTIKIRYNLQKRNIQAIVFSMVEIAFNETAHAWYKQSKFVDAKLKIFTVFSQRSLLDEVHTRSTLRVIILHSTSLYPAQITHSVQRSLDERRERRSCSVSSLYPAHHCKPKTQTKPAIPNEHLTKLTTSKGPGPRF
jgi:hypothetical protein